MADTGEKKSKLEQFCSVSGAPEDRARFYLESAAWNVETALATFFDGGSDEAMIEEHDDEPVVQLPPALARPTAPSGSSVSTDRPQPTQPPASRPRDPPRFATLGTLRADESDSSEEEGQAFYAGGSEHGGGQQIIGPKKKVPRDNDGIVSDMFRAARDHGAEVVEPAPNAAGSRPTAFQGRGCRLGDSENAPSEVVGSAFQPEVRERQVDMVLKMWKNGFSVDDGPLREFSAPENREFLNDIRNGDVPRELIQQARGSEVNLSLEDHRNEDYVKQATAVRAFTGEGHRLGCPSDPITVANTAARAMAGSSATSAAPAAASAPTPAAAATPTVALSESQPTTSIQIRLADGSRLVQKFNHMHRVSDVRQFIVDARPQYATVNFALMTSFPVADIKDESQTLDEAKLLNAVVTQRIIK